jgi:hypothetical protein
VLRRSACGGQRGRAACHLGLQQRQVQMLRKHAEQARQRGAVEETQDCVLVVGRKVEQCACCASWSPFASLVARKARVLPNGQRPARVRGDVPVHQHAR